MQLQIPDHLDGFLELQAAESGFASASAYVQQLIEEDRSQREALEQLARQHGHRLQSLALQGLASGPPIVIGADYWERKRQAILDQLRGEPQS
jgi:Arc/MetJ-type ribon-helix-helix transcriptional regulator